MNLEPQPGAPRTYEINPVDTGLSCPCCGYNLTGLLLPRCPECGSEFDWDAVRRAARHKSAIAFERARGLRRIPAFVVTWGTVLFAPWIFARQVMRHYRLGPALLFGALCFVPMSIRYVFFEGVDPAYFAWLSTAAIYILAQAALMIGLDPHGWRQPRATFLFWLAVGGYTSAIVVSEAIWFAPLLGIRDLWRTIWYQWSCLLDPTLSQRYGIQTPDVDIYGFLQLILWLFGLICCYWLRLGDLKIGGIRRVLGMVLVVLLLINLYAVCIDPIGMSFFGLFGGSLGLYRGSGYQRNDRVAPIADIPALDPHVASYFSSRR